MILDPKDPHKKYTLRDKWRLFIESFSFRKVRTFYLGKYWYNKVRSDQRYYLSYAYDRKAIWYRNAKVGTRTIQKIFKSLEGEEYFYGSPVSLPKKMLDQYFTFGFVRNPIKRFMSAWRDKIHQMNYFMLSEEEWERLKDLDNFIEWVGNQDITKVDEHIRSQVVLVDVDNVDFIGRMENFNEDLNKVLSHLGIENVEIAKENSTKKRYEPTDEQIHKIALMYQRDIRAFYPELIPLLTPPSERGDD